MTAWLLVVRWRQDGRWREARAVVEGDTIADALEEAPLGLRPEDLPEGATCCRFRCEPLGREADGAE